MPLHALRSSDIHVVSVRCRLVLPGLQRVAGAVTYPPREAVPCICWCGVRSRHSRSRSGSPLQSAGRGGAPCARSLCHTHVPGFPTPQGYSAPIRLACNQWDLRPI